MLEFLDIDAESTPSDIKDIEITVLASENVEE